MIGSLRTDDDTRQGDRVYFPALAWEHLRVLQSELADVAREKESGAPCLNCCLSNPTQDEQLMMDEWNKIDDGKVQAKASLSLPCGGSSVSHLFCSGFCATVWRTVQKPLHHKGLDLFSLGWRGGAIFPFVPDQFALLSQLLY